MKINKDLLKALQYNPTNKRQVFTISDFADNNFLRHLAIPAYKVSEFDKPKLLVDLLNQIFFGKAPIKEFTFNRNISHGNNSIYNFRCDQGTRASLPPIFEVSWVIIDGYKRLRTLVELFKNEATDPFENVFLNIQKGKFELHYYEDSESYKSSFIYDKNSPHLIRVTPLLSSSEGRFKSLCLFYSGFDKDTPTNMTKILIDLRAKFHYYKFTIVTGEDMSLDEQKELSEKINKGA